MNYLIYIVLFLGLLGLAIVSWFRIAGLRSAAVKGFLAALVGAVLVSGDFLLGGKFLQHETSQEHFVLPDVLALLACFAAGAIGGAMLCFVKRKDGSQQAIGGDSVKAADGLD